MMKSPEKPSPGDYVRITQPPYDHPMWSRRKKLSDNGLCWKVSRYKNLTYVRILRETGDVRQPYIGIHVPWKWLSVLSPLERLAIEANE